MSDFNYDSYCGLYCGACSIIKAYQTGTKDPFACFWSDEAGAELKCHGCKTDMVFQGAAEFGGCSRCQIRACAREKGVERCLSCPDFPCQNFNPDTDIAKYLIDKLPHMSVIADNLQTILNEGASRWLELQEAQWKCPECRTDYTWYATHCSNCGKDLGDRKPYRNTFDKSIFELMAMPHQDELYKKEVVFKTGGMETVKLQKNIVYSVDQGELLLDLYLPADSLPEKKLPVVVLIHGDTPIPNMKDAGSYTSIGRIVAASGMAAVSFNHRALVQGCQIKDVIADIENLIAFLINNADELGIEKNSIAIWSFSSGVPFGLYAGMHNSHEYIKCMIAYYGFGDFNSYCNLIGRADDQAEQYSLIDLLSQNSDDLAPMFIARAGMDQIPTLLKSLDNFIGAALANNLQLDVYNHHTGVHVFDLFNDNPRTHEIIEKTLEFLQRHLSTL